MARTIWLVMADTDYEGSEPVVGFGSREKAEAFAQRCCNYEAKKPRCPEMEDSDDKWEKWNARDERWRANHPAGELWGRGYFSVREIQVKP